MKHAFIYLVLIFATVAISSAEPFNWKQTKGPCEGYLSKIIRDSQGNVYAFTPTGELYKNEPGTEGWEFIKDDVADIIVDHQDNFYVRSKEDGSLGRYDGKMDFIKNVRTDSSLKYEIMKTDVDGDLYVSISQHGLYYSNDKGENWDKISPLKPWILCFDSVQTALFTHNYDSFYGTRDNWTTYDERNDAVFPKGAYHNALEYNQPFNTWIAQGEDSCLYVSADTGRNWKSICDYMNVSHYPITVTKDGTTYLYSEYSMWRSLDGGYTWDILYTDSLQYSVNAIVYRDQELISAGFFGVYKYDMVTTELTDFSDGIIKGPILDIISANDGALLTKGKLGIYSSYDDGETWERYNGGSKNFLYYGSEIYQSKSGILYLSQNTSLIKSKDNGASWQNVYRIKGQDTMDVNILAIDDKDRIYIQSGRSIDSENFDYCGKLFYTDDEGMTWDSIPIPSEDHNKYYTVYSMATYKNKVVITAEGYAYDVLFYSTDRGANFKEIPIIDHNYDNVSSVFNLKGDLYILLRNYEGADTLLISRDDGSTFQDKELPVKLASKLICDKNNYLYAMHGKDYFVSDYYVRSTDDGENWEYVVDTTNHKLKANVIYFDDKNQAFLGTVADGVWKADVIKGIPIENNSNHIALKISPNPATERATITLTENIGLLEITIYNQLGEIVYRRPMNGESRVVDIQTAEFPQGAYFVKVSTGGEIITGKFAVVK